MIKKYIYLASFLAAAFLLITCKKDYDEPFFNNKVELAAISTDSINYFTVKIKSRLNNTGGNTISDHGICWSTTPNPDITKEFKSYGYTAAPADISASLKNLLPGKKYYIRSYATIPAGTVYGAQNEFTTLKTGIPVSVTDTVTEITYTTALCKALAVADSGLMVTKRGICWSLTPEPTLSSTFDTLGKGLGTYEIKVDALNPSTTYYIRAFAVNDSGTSYGLQKTFKTVALTIPVLTTAPANTITTKTAVSGGTVTSDGGSPVTARGVCWSTLPNPTLADSYTTDSIGTGIFKSNLANLTPNTQYYFRAYATNSVGNAYGDLLTVTTSPVVLPSLITLEINTITLLSAASGGFISNDGGDDITARGVCWSVNPNPDITKSHSSDGTGPGEFASNLAGLINNTTYYVRAYATNSAGTAYGNELTFKTLAEITIPILSTTTATAITVNSAKTGGNITSTGGADVTARGVCYSISPDPTVDSSHTTDGTSSGVFVSTLAGLNPNTTYHIRAYATNSIGTAYGSDLTFTTLAITLPVLTTTAITSITANTATSGGNITDNGGATITARGVCWDTIQNPTLSAKHTTDGTETGIFTSNLTVLSPAKTYYVRAYATNSAGTAYGNELSFNTLSGITLPTLTTTAITGITTTTATSGGNISSDGDATVTERGVCWSTSQSPLITNSHTSDGTGASAFISSITGLNAATTYYVRAYATNSAGTAYGNEISFNTTAWACGSTITINHIAGSVAPVDKTVTYGTVTNIPGEPTKCWITSNLGADHQATSVDDATEASAGWYWQFNRKQGYNHDGTTRTPNSSWINPIYENSNWISTNDPCTLLLAEGWRIPTSSELGNIDATGGWNNLNDAFASSLKIHGAGFLHYSNGGLDSRSSFGRLWSNTQDNTNLANSLDMWWEKSWMFYNSKAYGFSLRCIHD